MFRPEVQTILDQPRRFDIPNPDMFVPPQLHGPCQTPMRLPIDKLCPSRIRWFVSCPDGRPKHRLDGGPRRPLSRTAGWRGPESSVAVAGLLQVPGNTKSDVPRPTVTARRSQTAPRVTWGSPREVTIL